MGKARLIPLWTDLAPGVRRYRLLRDGAPMRYADVVEGWKSDAGFRGRFNALLAGAPFDVFRWETPGVTAATVAAPFECVLVRSPELDVPADRAPFTDLFAAAGDQAVIVSPNLGGDAVLVVPCPRAPPAAYPHLGAFVRDAPPDQHDALWQSVGGAVDARIGTRPLWLSTAGGGVAWLHVRLDDRPKYYAHAPYRTPPA
jgi:hypothetical protein